MVGNHSRKPVGAFGYGFGIGRRRPWTKLKPRCEALDDRQLLSTMAAMPGPSAAAVASAAAALNALDPTTFARFQGDLAQAEGRSHVTAAQASKLAQDETAIDQAMNAASQDPNSNFVKQKRNVAIDGNQVQNAVDYAFTSDVQYVGNVGFAASHGLLGWANRRIELQQSLQLYSGMAPGWQGLIHRTIAEVQVVNRAIRTTPQLQVALSSDWTILENDLRPTETTTPGPAGPDLDPLQVYYDGQVNNFIK